MNFTVCQSNSNVLKAKTVNVVNDGSNIVCVSCGKDVFMLSHKKCVARYALSIDSRVKRALFTSPVAAKSKDLGATSVVVKSRFSVAKIPTATNKVSSASSLSPDSSQSRKLSNYMKTKIATSRKWQKCGCMNHMTDNLQLLRKFIEKFIGTVCFGNDHFTAITGYGDYVQGNLTICHIYYNLEGEDLLTGSRVSNLYTISISELAVSSLIQQSLQAQVLKVRSDNGTEFKNENMRTFYAKLGITHNTSTIRTPQQNGVVERRNRTLFEAARTMLIFSKTLEFLWAEAIATA
ncbi:retrovirus-related pol polyprotein from transposon TNT 1-94 [Tanacetum coccineum]